MGMKVCPDHSAISAAFSVNVLPPAKRDVGAAACLQLPIFCFLKPIARVGLRARVRRIGLRLTVEGRRRLVMFPQGGDMNQRFKTFLAGGVLALALFGTATAGLLGDVRLHQKGDYATALKIYRPSSRNASRADRPG